MQIQYSINEDDFVSAGKLAIRSRSRFAIYRQYLVPSFGVLIIAAAVAGAIIRGNPAGLWISLIWGSVLACVPLLSGYQLRRAYRKTPLLHDRRTLEIDGTTLHFTSASSESRTTWTPYIKFAENNDTFIVFQQGNQIFIPIPKRELTESQITELRFLFETHLPPK